MRAGIRFGRRLSTQSGRSPGARHQPPRPCPTETGHNPGAPRQLARFTSEWGFGKFEGKFPVRTGEQCLLSADMAGCWRLMGVDEKGMHQRLKAHRPELIKRELKVLNAQGDLQWY
jgi:hypothetical protein